MEANGIYLFEGAKYTGLTIPLSCDSIGSLSTPWQFHTWDFDLIGPINLPSRGHIWILIEKEYYTKWVEAIALKRAGENSIYNYSRQYFLSL